MKCETCGGDLARGNLDRGGQEGWCPKCAQAEMRRFHPRELAEAKVLLQAAADLMGGSHASTMFEDQCGYLAEQINEFLHK